MGRNIQPESIQQTVAQPAPGRKAVFRPHDGVANRIFDDLVGIKDPLLLQVQRGSVAHSALLIMVVRENQNPPARVRPEPGGEDCYAAIRGVRARWSMEPRRYCRHTSSLPGRARTCFHRGCSLAAVYWIVRLSHGAR